MQSTSSNVNASMAQPQENIASQGIRQPDLASDTMEIMDIAVHGLPKPLFCHKCYVEVTVAEQKRTTSKVERSSDGNQWHENFRFIVTPEDVLEIRIYDKRIMARKYKFVGGIQEIVQVLRSQGGEQATTRNLVSLGIRVSDQIQGRITFHVIFRSSDLPSDILQLGDQVDQANQSLDRSGQTPSILNTSDQIVGFVNRAAGLMDTLDTCLKPLLDRFEVFVKIVDRLAEVHPYAKVAWSVLSFTYKVAQSQKIRDEAIQNLTVTMSEMYTFLCEAEQVKRFESQAKILTVMLKQTEECAHFIRGYAETKSFLTRTAKHLFTSVDDKIKGYQAKFAHLKEAFQGYAVLQTEIVVTRIMDLVSHTSAAIDLNDLPYAPGVRFSGTARCLPGTREGILEQIQLLLSGIKDDGKTRIVLLTGVAGYGKSAIASTIAERFEERGRLTSSFFFNRNDHNRNRVDNVFTTMARDIADSNPEIKEKLWTIIKDSRSLRTTTDVREQFARFILIPIQQVTTIGPVTAVFDGVDECGNPETRVPFLEVLAKEFPGLPDNFRIFITARPDDDIVRSLGFLPFVKHIRAQDIERQSTEADLSVFVSNELSMVKTELEEEWPEMRWRDELVQNADCLFIWVSTACRFVKNMGKGGTNYSQRLKLILVSNSASLAPLDNLYLNVLKGAFDETDSYAMIRLKAVLGKVLAAEVPLSGIALSDFLEVDGLESYKNGRFVVESVMRYLGSVLIGTTDLSHPLQVLHLSFKDFLTDASRSGSFFIDLKEERKTMAKLCLELMNQHLKHDLIQILEPTSPTPELSQVRSRMEKFETLQYACRYWVDHTVDLETCDETIFNRIRTFFNHNALHWMETLSLTKQFDSAFSSLQQLENWLKLHQAEHDMKFVMDLIYDLKRTCLAFGRLIVHYALQVYSSVMTFVPRETVLVKHYEHQNESTCVHLNARSHWPSLLATLSGHTHSVDGICFSPDSTRLASCSRDCTVRLWDAHTGSAIGDALVGHTHFVNDICFSPDGTRLASCSWDHTVRLWDAHTGSADALVGHTHSVNGICFSPEGTRLASCSRDRTVRLWDAHTGNAIGHALVGHTLSVNDICFSPDGTRLASCSRDCTVRLWDAHTGNAIGHALVGHTLSVNDICFSPDGTRLASCSRDRTVRLWDAHTGNAIGHALVGHTHSVNDICFSPDGTRLVSCSLDRTLRLWDAHTGSAIGDALVGHTHFVNSICFSPDGTRLASCSQDRTVRLWDAHTGSAIGDALVGHTHFVNDICFSPDGTRLASCSEDDTVRLWDAHTESAIGDALVGHTDFVNDICFSPDGTRLASCSEDGTVRLWDAQTGNADALAGHTHSVNDICFSPDGTRLASRSLDRTVRLWDAHTGSAIGDALVGHTDFVNDICFSPDGTRLASCSRDCTVRLWDAHTGSAIGDALVGHTLSVNDICFSPDGTRLASCSVDDTVRLWDAHTGNAIGHALVGHTHSVNNICFSPDGTRLASCSVDCTVRFWDALTGSAIGDALVGHTHSVNDICFSPDGTRLASCSRDRTVRLWDALTGSAIGDALVGHTHSVNGICFSPDGTRLATTSAEETIIWDLSSLPIVEASQQADFLLSPTSFRNVKVRSWIDSEGWLKLYGNRALWIPEQYRGEAFGRIGDAGTIVCVGGKTGTVSILWFPHIQ